MKKINPKQLITLCAVACLGLGSGIYAAHSIYNIDLSDIVNNDTRIEQLVWDVKHSNWSGKLIQLSDNRVQLDINGDMATIMSNENNVLTVKWDNWGTETFKCDTQHSCVLQ